MTNRPDEGTAARNRELYRARWEQGLSTPHIASLFGLSRSAVYKILARAFRAGVHLEYTLPPGTVPRNRRRILDQPPIDDRHRILGNRVAYYRYSVHGLGLRQAALLFGMSDAKLGKIERGVCQEVTLSDIDRLSVYFGRTIEEMIRIKFSAEELTWMKNRRCSTTGGQREPTDGLPPG